MSWSLNEVEALARKAARGAGMSWGLAEETGRATRWLLEHGVDAPPLLAELLTRIDGVHYSQLAPTAVEGVWKAPAGVLCPIAAGACLSDHADAVRDRGTTKMQDLLCPAFLLPFAARIGPAMVLTWDHLDCTAHANGIWCSAGVDALSVTSAGHVRCRTAQQPDTAPLPRLHPVEMSDGIAGHLGTFAHRTYAPATDASRTSGAGAGTSDND